MLEFYILFSFGWNNYLL